MQNGELTYDESEVLREVLQHAVNELDIEIGRTDTHDFKEKLKQRRLILENLLSKLCSVSAVV